MCFIRNVFYGMYIWPGSFPIPFGPWFHTSLLFLHLSLIAPCRFMFMIFVLNWFHIINKLYCDYSFQTIMLGNCVKLTKTKEIIISADRRRKDISRKPAQCDRQREERKKRELFRSKFSWSTATLHIYSLTSDLDPQFDWFIWESVFDEIVFIRKLWRLQCPRCFKGVSLP